MSRALSLVIFAIYALLASAEEAQQGSYSMNANIAEAEPIPSTSADASTTTEAGTTLAAVAACVDVSGVYKQVVTATGQEKPNLTETATQTGCNVSWVESNGMKFAMTVSGSIINASANGSTLQGTVQSNGSVVWGNGATSVKQQVALPAVTTAAPIAEPSDAQGPTVITGTEGALGQPEVSTSLSPGESDTEDELDDEAEEGIDEHDQSGTLADRLKNVDWSMATERMVRGLIKAFFHMAALEHSEKKCLRTQAGGFVSDITGLTTDAVTALKPIISEKSVVNKSEGKNMMGLMMDGVMKVTDLVAVLTVLLKTCVKGDGLVLLNSTAHHLINFTYMEDRFLVAGVDIANAVAQGIMDFEKQHFYEFGEQVGIALRKILLSNKGGAIVLPEGMAKDEVVAEISEGIAAGFFAKGSQVVIKDVAKPDVDIDIDLNSCIVQNHQLFKEVFKALWTLFAQLAANAEQHQFGINMTSAPPMWVNELLLAVMRIPTALSRCGVMDEDMEDMFSEAMKTLGSIRFDFKFPEDKIQADKATEKVALAVEFFAHHKFKLFGKELGKLFRELLLLAFPAKYSIDASGRLQRNILGKTVNFGQGSGFGYVTLAILGVAFMLLMSLVVAKTWRTVASWRNGSRRYLVDLESDGDDLQVLE